VSGVRAAGFLTNREVTSDVKVHGIAPLVGAQVANRAAAREVLVSSTVKDLVAGSGIEFADKGIHTFTDVPG
jgi:hypothetical protein